MDDIDPEDLRRHQTIENLIRRHRELIVRARAIVEESRRLRAAWRQEREQARARLEAVQGQNVICIEQAKTALAKSADAVCSSMASVGSIHGRRGASSCSGRR
ncbi:hypothetical protein [Azospirillum sp.]|uniref:hypothetical protein n=1 Tax=Azospirillum sp. TaxID=34012 RepID=UPI002D3C5F33|nr:hypothetical protein [Azospirillum sp.]HYD67125.1 hypothetical protein [Azospirillum sp.]